MATAHPLPVRCARTSASVEECRQGRKSGVHSGPGSASRRRGSAAGGGVWARSVVVAVLVLLVLVVPHHRLVLWLTDALLVKYWKELAFALACLAFATAVLRRGTLTRAERRGVLLAAPFVLAVLARIVVGLLRQEDRYLLLVGGGSHVYYVPVFLLAIYLLETSRRGPVRQVERVLRWGLVVTSLAVLLSVADQFLHISGIFDPFPGRRSRWMVGADAELWRSLGTYQSPMILGMITGTGFLLCLYLLVTRLAERPRPWRELAGPGVLGGLHLLGLYLTFSRGPLVATACGAAVIGLFRGKGLDPRRLSLGWRKVAAGTAGAVAAIALVIILLPPALQRHLGSIFDWSGDQHNVTRLERMAIGFEYFREAPWIGQGVGTAQGRLSNYRFRELGEDYFFTNPESQFLTWAAEGGLLLLLPALLVMGFMLHTAFAMASPEQRTAVRRLGVLFLGLQAALYSQALIMPILNGRTFQLGFWSLFGVLVVFRDELRRPSPEGADPDGGAGRRPRSTER